MDRRLAAALVGLYAVGGIATAALGSGALRQVSVGVMAGTVVGLAVVWLGRSRWEKKVAWVLWVTGLSFLLLLGWSVSVTRQADAPDPSPARVATAPTPAPPPVAWKPPIAWAPPRPGSGAAPAGEIPVATAMPGLVPGPPIAEPQAPPRVAAVCLQGGGIAGGVHYQYRLGDGPWHEVSVAAGASRWHSWVLDEADPTSPRLTVRFDRAPGAAVDLVERPLPLRIAEPPVTCARAERYRFELGESGRLGLASARWLEGWPHPFHDHIVATGTASRWTPAPGYRLVEDGSWQAIPVGHGLIGSVIIWDPERGLPRVRSVRAGGPADRAGLRAGDLLFEIQGRPPTPSYLDRIIGPRDTHVTLLAGPASTGAARLLRIQRVDPDELWSLAIEAKLEAAREARQRTASRAAPRPAPGSPPAAPAPSSRRAAVEEPRQARPSQPPSMPSQPPSTQGQPPRVPFLTPQRPERGVTPPRRISGRLPGFLRPPFRSRRDPDVLIELEIDERGRVVGAEVVEGLPPEQAGWLVEAVREWRYAPATRYGEPIAMKLPVRIRFD